MGCRGSKPKAGADVAVADVYRPPPTSVSLFDISAVEEPWLIAKNKKDGDEEDDDEDDEKKPIVNTTVALLDKLEGYELAPASWSEVSKALEDMKPALEHTKPSSVPKRKKKTKKEEKPAAAEPAPSVEGAAADIEEEEIKEKAPPPELAGRRVVKDNP